MPQMNMIEAVRDALDIKMDKDPDVVTFGEEIGHFGGVFRCTKGYCGHREAWRGLVRCQGSAPRPCALTRTKTRTPDENRCADR